MSHSSAGKNLLPEQRVIRRTVFHRRGALSISNGAKIPVRTIDISPHGLQFLCDDPIPFRQQCSLCIDLLHHGVPGLLELRGTVSHCILSGKHGFKIGIQYAELNHKSKALIEHIIQQAA